MAKADHRFWTTRNGESIPIWKMSNNHLVNTIRYLRRRAESVLEEEISACASCGTWLQGEMSTYYVEHDLDMLTERDPVEHLLIQEPRYKVMLDIANHRHLDIADLLAEVACFEDVAPTSMELIGFSSNVGR